MARAEQLKLVRISMCIESRANRMYSVRGEWKTVMQLEVRG